MQVSFERRGWPFVGGGPKKGPSWELFPGLWEWGGRERTGLACALLFKGDTRSPGSTQQERSANTRDSIANLQKEERSDDGTDNPHE